MKKENVGFWGAVGGSLAVLLAIIAVKIAFWVAVVWAIVKLVQHFAG